MQISSLIFFTKKHGSFFVIKRFVPNANDHLLKSLYYAAVTKTHF